MKNRFKDWESGLVADVELLHAIEHALITLLNKQALDACEDRRTGDVHFFVTEARRFMQTSRKIERFVS